MELMEAFLADAYLLSALSLDFIFFIWNKVSQGHGPNSINCLDSLLIKSEMLASKLSLPSSMIQ